MYVCNHQWIQQRPAYRFEMAWFTKRLISLCECSVCAHADAPTVQPIVIVPRKLGYAALAVISSALLTMLKVVPNVGDVNLISEFTSLHGQEDED